MRRHSRDNLLRYFPIKFSTNLSKLSTSTMLITHLKLVCGTILRFRVSLLRDAIIMTIQNGSNTPKPLDNSDPRRQLQSPTSHLDTSRCSDPEWTHGVRRIAHTEQMDLFQWQCVGTSGTPASVSRRQSNEVEIKPPQAPWLPAYSIYAVLLLIWSMISNHQKQSAPSFGT